VKEPDYNALTFEMVQARYHSPMDASQMNESWLALRREMLRSRWAKVRGLKDEDVGIAICPRTGKAFFQWKPALQFLNPAPTPFLSCTPNAPPR
jgi:hypothetical protein